MAYALSALSSLLRDQIEVYNENGACFYLDSNGVPQPVVDTGAQVYIVMSTETTPLWVYADNTVATLDSNGAAILIDSNGAAILDSNGATQVDTTATYRRVAVPAGLSSHDFVRDAFKTYDAKYKRYIVDFTNALTKAVWRRRLGRG